MEEKSCDFLIFFRVTQLRWAAIGCQPLATCPAVALREGESACPTGEVAASDEASASESAWPWSWV